MKITQKWLKEKGACSGGINWFTDKFYDDADYQEVLYALALENKADWANWLILKAGKMATLLPKKVSFLQEELLLREDWNWFLFR